MNKQTLIATVAIASVSAISANAADVSLLTPPPRAPAYNWSGLYAGVNAGAAWGSYDPRTSTSFVPLTGYLPAALIPAVNAPGVQSINTNGFTGGSQLGYNWQSGHLLLGAEADFNFLHLNGAANSGFVQYPGFAPNGFVISSYAHSDWLFTARPRIGYAQDNWLLYATGGLALTNVNGDFLFTDSFGALQSAHVNATKAGYAAGGGIEWGLTNQLSLKAEYLHANFNRVAAGETSSNFASIGARQPFNQSADLTANIVRLGLNYRLGAADAPYYGSAMPVKAPAWKAPALVGSDWEIDVGSRVWFSSGRLGAPNPLFNAPPTVLASRLDYNDLHAYSGETFARVDHASGVFVKGILGAGAISSGKLFDEDFPAFNAYSNTLSSATGHLAYATIDLGYNVLQSPGAKIGPFVGYNYFTQHINTYSCSQLAGDAVCTSGFPPNFLGIAEDDRFNSVRLGVSSQFMLTDRLKLTAEAAYLPWVNFKGQDDHNARELLLPETSSNGNGVQLEAILGYKVTNNWNVGIGGRYWAWNMRDGTTTFNFLAAPGVVFVEPSHFNAERYGVFFQSDYHWGGPAVANAMPVKAGIPPMNWTGFYVGGHLGGGWGDDHWRDPFGSSPSGFGGINIAGFGDTTHATGPLAGGQIGLNWQTGHVVLGAETDASWADIRGENTCFSGIGGVNCQRVVNSLGSVTGRVGYAWDRSLAYAKGGGAWTNTTYNILGNTNAMSLGVGSTSANAWGWTAGAGLEYAITNNWTTMLEYDHIDIGSVNTPFPSVAVIGAQNIGVKQSIDLIKLGANYKLNWGMPY